MYTYSMKIITKLASILILVGCATTQSNIEVDSIDTFNLSKSKKKKKKKKSKPESKKKETKENV